MIHRKSRLPRQRRRQPRARRKPSTTPDPPRRSRVRREQTQPRIRVRMTRRRRRLNSTQRKSRILPRAAAHLTRSRAPPPIATRMKCNRRLTALRRVTIRARLPTTRTQVATRRLQPIRTLSPQMHRSKLRRHRMRRPINRATVRLAKRSHLPQAVSGTPNRRWANSLTARAIQPRRSMSRPQLGARVGRWPRRASCSGPSVHSSSRSRESPESCTTPSVRSCLVATACHKPRALCAPAETQA